MVMMIIHLRMGLCVTMTMIVILLEFQIKVSSMAMTNKCLSSDEYSTGTSFPLVYLGYRGDIVKIRIEIDTIMLAGTAASTQISFCQGDNLLSMKDIGGQQNVHEEITFISLDSILSGSEIAERKSISILVLNTNGYEYLKSAEVEYEHTVYRWSISNYNLGHFEYHVTTLCYIYGKCEIGISTFYKTEFQIEIFLKMKNPHCYVRLGDDFYFNGDVIIKHLSRLRAIQLQSDCDLTGTIIISPKRLTVLNGGVETFINGNSKPTTVISTVPGINCVGKEYAVFVSDYSALGDEVRVLTTEPNTTIRTFGEDVMIGKTGVYIRRIYEADVLHIRADKKIYVTQLTRNHKGQTNLVNVIPFVVQSSYKCQPDEIIIMKSTIQLDSVVSFDVPSEGKPIRVPDSEIPGSRLVAASGCVIIENNTHFCSREDLFSYPTVIFDKVNCYYLGRVDEGEENIFTSGLLTRKDETNYFERSNYGTHFIIPIVGHYLGHLGYKFIGTAEDQEGFSNFVTIFLTNETVDTFTAEKSFNRDIKFSTLGIGTTGETNKFFSLFCTTSIMLHVKIMKYSQDPVALFLVHPIEVLGTRYVVGTHCGDDTFSACSFVPTKRGDVEIDLSVTALNADVYFYHRSYSILLNAISFSFNVSPTTQVTLIAIGDLTGTIIRSNVPLALVCGCVPANESPLIFFAIEQLPSVAFLGNHYEVCDVGVDAEDSIRVIATEYFTHVSIIVQNEFGDDQDVIPSFLQEIGDFVYFSLPQSSKVLIKSSAPVLVIRRTSFQNLEEKSLTVLTPLVQAKSIYFIALNYKEFINPQFTLDNSMTPGQVMNISTHDPTAVSVFNTYLIYGSSAGQLFKRKKICVHGLDTDIDCASSNSVELCVLKSYKKGLSDAIHIQSPGSTSGGSDAERLYQRQTLKLSDFGHDIQYKNDLHFWVKSCDDIIIYLSESPIEIKRNSYAITYHTSSQSLVVNAWRNYVSTTLREESTTLNACNKYERMSIHWTTTYLIIKTDRNDMVVSIDTPPLILDIGVHSKVKADWIFNISDDVNKMYITTAGTITPVNIDYKTNAISLSLYEVCPNSESTFRFKIKTCEEALLFVTNEITQIEYVIVIGKEFITVKDVWSGEVFGESKRGSFLACDVFQSFWIEWTDPLSMGTNATILWNIVPVVGFGKDNIEDLHISTTSYDGQWIIQKQEPSFDPSVDLPDFDLDGVYDDDDDCFWNTTHCSPPVFKNANVLNYDNIEGSIGFVECDDRFYLKGNQRTQCLSSGVWSKEFICVPDESTVCTYPPELQFARIKSPSYFIEYMPGNKSYYECMEGYEANNDTVIVCNTDGSWSNPLFECLPAGSAVCPYPPKHPFAKTIDPAIPAEYKPGQISYYDCLDGYEPNNYTSVVCKNDGSWSKPVFECLPSQCPPCDCQHHDLSEEEIKTIQDNIRRENEIDKKNTSSYRRRKTSAPDNRTSAKAIGYVGVTFLTSTVVVIVALDVMSLINTVQTAVQNIKAML